MSAPPAPLPTDDAPSPWQALLAAEARRIGLDAAAVAPLLAAAPAWPRGWWQCGAHRLAFGQRTLLLGVVDLPVASPDDSAALPEPLAEVLSGETPSPPPSPRGRGSMRRSDLQLTALGAVVERGLALVAAGADLLTLQPAPRTRDAASDAAVEHALASAVIGALHARLPTMPLVIATARASVGAAAVAAGASVVDARPGADAAALLALAARTGAGVIVHGGGALPRRSARTADSTPEQDTHSMSRGTPSPQPSPSGRGSMEPPILVQPALARRLQRGLAAALEAGCQTEQVALDLGPRGDGTAATIHAALLAAEWPARPLVLGPLDGRGRSRGEAMARAALAVADGVAVLRVRDAVRLGRAVRMADAIVQASLDD